MCMTIMGQGRESAASTEQLLAAAGFQQPPFGDSAWQQYVAALPPYRLVTRLKDGRHPS
jgi:hypothetical protein